MADDEDLYIDNYREHRLGRVSSENFRTFYGIQGIKLLRDNVIVTQLDEIFLVDHREVEYVVAMKNVIDVISNGRRIYTLDDNGDIKFIALKQNGEVLIINAYENKGRYDLVRFCNGPEEFDRIYVQDSEGHIYKKVLNPELIKLDLPERSMHLHPIIRRIKSARNLS